MFITAKAALIDAGAHARWMPYEVTVQYQTKPGGVWFNHAKGRNTDYLADSYTDMQAIWTCARLINSATGEEIYRGRTRETA
jgi:hypothetical protein